MGIVLSGLDVLPPFWEQQFMQPPVSSVRLPGGEAKLRGDSWHHDQCLRLNTNGQSLRWLRPAAGELYSESPRSGRRKTPRRVHVRKLQIHTKVRNTTMPTMTCWTLCHHNIWEFQKTGTPDMDPTKGSAIQGPQNGTRAIFGSSHIWAPGPSHGRNSYDRKLPKP